LTGRLADLPDPTGILLDLDGTLVATVELRIEGWMRTFNEIGIDADRDHVARMIGADGKRLAQEVAGVAGHEISRDRAEAIDRRAGQVFSELNTDPKPLPGARKLLLALESSRLRWAIATSSLREQTSKSVAALNLPVQPVIVDGSHVEHAKPAPDLFLQAIERLGVQPAQTWSIGDATWDIRAAHAVPMPAIGVATGAVGRDVLRAAGADAVASLASVHADLRRRGLVAQG
jgi:HAD superfamily hydrolase (TIGR01509 family)